MFHARHVAALLLFAGPTLAQLPHARQVSAPPEDILSGVVALPDPAAATVRSKTALILCDFEEHGEQWVFETAFDRNGGEPLVLLPFGTHREEWALDLCGPGSGWVSLEDLVQSGQARAIGAPMPGPSGGPWVEGAVVESAQGGEWRLRIRAPKTRGERAPSGRLLLSGSGPLRLASHLSTQRLLSNAPIGLVAGLVDPHAGDRPVLGVVEDARLILETGWGRIELPMMDDGLHADGMASDGRYGALLPAGLSGDVRAIATLRGRTAEGSVVQLSGQHAFTILEPALLLTGQAVASATDARFLEFAIGVQPLRELDRLHVSTEVWGRRGAAAAVPVAWLSRMVRAYPSFDGSATVVLSLDGRWLSRAAQAVGLDELELRELRIQDPDTHVVLDRLEALPVLLAGELPPSAYEDVPAVTRDMLMGPPDRRFAGGADPRSIQRHGSLMLVHGYCSGGSVWPAADFDDPKIEFLDPDQNRTHDQFAQLMLARGAGQRSFGVLAHSQGGAAALHLLTYYTSGLDFAHGPRRIQTVATPYQGTPLASFGIFACGTNQNMTPAGAQTWLSGIPSWARDEVHYWTTVDAGSACSFLANLILDDDDNDGTVERFRGILPGGHDMGHVAGWCHTTGMTFPANYTDHARNMARNVAAAR